MLRFCNLASGSSGNATLIEAGSGTTRTRVLIDAGLSWRDLGQRLGRRGLALADLDAVFITHEHIDHVGCALQLRQRLGIALWASHGTWAALGAQATCPAPEHFARDGEPLPLGDVLLHPFTVPHDAREPLQLKCTDGQRSVGLLTDLGHLTPHVLKQLALCDALLLECNHDADMLARSVYPAFLKQRVRGPLGHLSNEQAARALAQLAHPRLGAVHAAHLSERNNRPDMARAALALALGCKPAEIQVCDPGAPGPWHTV
ncbi:MAG: MBL fold metallo-hydrolase [Burkholderiaceae bacterium]|jgi:phosphoribosyl 1,2-cyclic phosphodiesterase|nr:MBL fold metallo-hydrolase [Burkholderiaceae bacterium]